MQYLFLISDYDLVKHIRHGTTTRQKDTHGVSEVIMTHKQTNICSAIAMNVFNGKTTYFLFQRYIGSYMSNFGSKGQRSTFVGLSECTYFLTRYCDTLLVSISSYFVLRFRVVKERCPESLRTNCH